MMDKVDFVAWLEMRRDLWPHCPLEKHEAEMAGICNGSGFDGDFLCTEVLFEKAPDGELLGFVELSLRERLEDFSSSPVAYVEGWYIRPEWRGKGLGSSLMSDAERWAKAHGCVEIASDTEPDNRLSLSMHQHLGYREYGRGEEGILLLKSLAEHQF